MSLFERYAKGGKDPKLKDWAGKTLPALQHHSRWRRTSARSNQSTTWRRPQNPQSGRINLERALRALEDVHQSLKEFSTTDTVTNNDAIAAELKTIRRKAKKLRKYSNSLAASWDRRFESGR